MTEDEMVGWHHQPDGHEFEQTPGDSEENGSLLCCSPWSLKELDMTEQLSLSFLYSNTSLLKGWFSPLSLGFLL